jgi:hypothetical protein
MRPLTALFAPLPASGHTSSVITRPFSTQGILSARISAKQAPAKIIRASPNSFSAHPPLSIKKIQYLAFRNPNIPFIQQFYI